MRADADVRSFRRRASRSVSSRTRARSSVAALANSGRGLEDLLRRGLGPAPEEGGVRPPLQQHQDEAEREEDDRDHERRADPEPRVAGLGVGRVCEVDALLHEDVAENDRTGEWSEADKDDVLRALEQLPPVIDRAREASEPEV